MALCKKWWLVFGAVILAFSLSACKKTEAELSQDQPEQVLRRILFVTDDVESDFAALSWKLLQECAAKADVQVTLSEVQYQADKASTTLNQASEGLYDMVILDRLSGETATEWVQRNAGYYPGVQYLCLDAAPQELADLDNVTWLIWDDAEIYYLYGTAASLNSQTGTVAFLGSESGIRSENRFLAFYTGVKDAAPQTRALYYALDKAAGEQSLTSVLGTISNEQADVICSQYGTNADLLARLVEQSPAMFFIGDTTITAADMNKMPQIMASFSFETRRVLSRLFDECCKSDLKAGVRNISWSSGDIHLRKSLSYPGEISQEAQAHCQSVEQKGLYGTLHVSLVNELNADERQQKITEASQKNAEK